MFKNVLLAVDGSEESNKAVEWAKAACEEAPGARFTFIYVHQPYLLADPGSYLPIMPVGYETAAMLEMPDVTPAQEAAQQFGIHGRVSAVNRQGLPAADLICEEAKKIGADLIVLGSRGHGVVASVLLGSVSSKVLHYAECPVLVLR